MHPRLTLNAYFPAHDRPFDAECQSLSMFIDKLRRTEPLLQGAVVEASDIDPETGGLQIEALFDPVNELDAAIAYLRREGFDGEEEGGPKTFFMSLRDGPFAVFELTYSWGYPNSGSARFTIKTQPYADAPPLPDLNRLSALLEAIVDWQMPLYVSVGDHSYLTQERAVFHPHRAPVNLMAWVQGRVNPGQVPSAQTVTPFAGGTMIATNANWFTAQDENAVGRANDVEVELQEAQRLPLMNDL